MNNFFMLNHNAQRVYFLFLNRAVLRKAYAKLQVTTIVLNLRE